MPLNLVLRWLFAIVGVVVLLAAAYLIDTWIDGGVARDAAGVLHRVHGAPWRLWLAAALIAWSFLGRFPTLLLLRRGVNEPASDRCEGGFHEGPDGSRLWVESCGRAGGPTLVLTHGWGMNATIWSYAKRQLSDRFRLVMWDLPGLGRSKLFSDGKISLARFAECLKTVAEAQNGPVVLVGHSIGGMITQTLQRDHPGFVTSRALGLALVDTSYTNPLRTMVLSRLFTALRAPLIVPMLWMQILFSPLVWLMNWKSYLDGSMLIITRITGFGRFATRGQVDLTSRLAVKGSPGVQAKGDLAMIDWDATNALSSSPIPALVLCGDKDIITLPRASESIAQQARRGRLLVIEGCGHMGFLERAETYNTAIGEFAAGLFAGAERPGGAPGRVLSEEASA